MDVIREAEKKLRDLVRSPIRFCALLNDDARWFKLCSALDVIGDTQLAVQAFREHPDSGVESDGAAYLVVYGILQVLYVQQDAARCLANCLGFELELPPELRAIRDSRNAAIGHPTDYKRGTRSTAISRHSLSGTGFQMLVHGPARQTEFRHVSLVEAVESQTKIIGDLLARGAEQLMATELQHRRRFRDNPLRAVFQGTLGYALEKLSEGLREPESRSFAEWGLEHIVETLARFKELLRERGLADAYPDSVSRALAELDLTIARIRSRLAGSQPTWNEQDDEVYQFLLRGKLDELERMAGEIDAEFQSDEV